MQQAYDRFITIEQLAQSIIHAIPLGSPKPLPSRILAAGRILVQQPGLPKIAAASPDSFPSELPSSLPRCPLSTVCSCCQKCRIITGKEKALRSELCKFITRAYDQNIISSSSGSFSARIPADGSHHDINGNGIQPAFSNSSQTEERGLSMLVTPTNVDRKTMESMDLCFVSSKHSCHHHCECPKNKGSGSDDSNEISAIEAVHSTKKRRTDAKDATVSTEKNQLVFHPINCSGSLFETFLRPSCNHLPRPPKY